MIDRETLKNHSDFWWVFTLETRGIEGFGVESMGFMHVCMNEAEEEEEEE